MIFISGLLLILSIFSGLVFSNFGQAQDRARDTQRKSDINTLYSKLEEHYNENGFYPNYQNFNSNTLNIRDEEAFIDPNGQKIPNGDYSYIPSECSFIGCQDYVISATLEDGSIYDKDALN